MNAIFPKLSEAPMNVAIAPRAANPHAQLVSTLETIRELVERSRGMEEKVRDRVLDATYSIETQSRAYMEPAAPIEWALWGLNKSQRIMAMLMHARLGKLVTKSAFHDALYYARGDSAPEIKIIDVLICKMRHAISQSKECPYRIETIWGQGYRMVPKEEYDPNRYFGRPSLESLNAA